MNPGELRRRGPTTAHRLAAAAGLWAAWLTPAAAAEPAGLRFAGLDRLYFRQLESPTDAEPATYLLAELERLLPPALGEGEGAAEPRVVDDLDGPTHGGLEIRDLPLPDSGDGTAFLRQLVDRTHPRLSKQYWALYSGGRRSDLWFFSTFPDRELNDSKLLSPLIVRQILPAAEGELILRIAGSVIRPLGGGWMHGVDLTFATGGGELRYLYAVRRYSFTFGYDQGEERSGHFGVEDVRVEDGKTVLLRQVYDGLLAPALAETCGIDPLTGFPDGTFDELVEVAACLASTSGSTTERRGPEEPSFMERGVRRPLSD